MSSLFTCSVCLGSSTDHIIFTCCGQVYCWPCISGWTRVQAETGFPCPTCEMLSLSAIFNASSVADKVDDAAAVEATLDDVDCAAAEEESIGSSDTAPLRLNDADAAKTDDGAAADIDADSEYSSGVAEDAADVPEDAAKELWPFLFQKKEIPVPGWRYIETEDPKPSSIPHSPLPLAADGEDPADVPEDAAKERLWPFLFQKKEIPVPGWRYIETEDPKPSSIPHSRCIATPRLPPAPSASASC
ncbi:hypothetical protein L7F22_013149 [Adiantum nelumboides]|nr:hypothetical protein [Adiantum nelumboides]